MFRKFRALAIFLLLALLSFPVGSQTNTQADVEQRVNSLLSRMTLEEKVDMIGGVERFYIRANDRLGIPELKMADGPIGVRNYGPATTFAGGIALAATWDPRLVERASAIIGKDARARGVHFLLGPGVNIHRTPMCARNFEYFGEDPFLASRTAVAYIKGVQSQGVIATVKHFMGNNSEFDRHKVNSIIDERTMREIYLPVFEAAVKEAHVGAIMDSYNLTNGLHMTQNDYLNNQVAKKEWGFDGIMMSDWDATYDGIAAANAGLDLEMPSGKFMNRTTLLPAIQAGTVSVATIDDKIRRILRKAIQFGFLDRDQTDRSIPLYNLEGRQVALEAARNSMVLLKNDGNLLPLDKAKTKSILIVGPDAYPGQPVGGGSARVQPFAATSYMEGIANYLGGASQVYYHRGLAPLNDMVQATEFSTAESGGQPGLNAEYFDNMELKGTPVATHTDRRVNLTGNFAPGIPANSYSIRWTGYFTPPHAGEYHLIVSGVSDRVTGGRLYLDGKLVMDNWDRVTLVNYVTTSLQPASHKIVLEYFKGSGAPRVSLAIVASQGIVDREIEALASRADAVVVAVGFDPSTEAEGSDRTFQLPAGQDELIREVIAANKNVIIVITAGGNVDMTRWIDRVPAVFHAWYPGQEGGTAFAQLLFGDYSPSGRLPVSFERRWEDNAAHDSYYPKNAQTRDVNYSEGVFLGYRHFDRAGIKPLFPFGYGLSYTTFAYKNLSISPAAATREGPVVVAFDVTNTGSRAGAEVAQLYVGDKHASVPRPPKELKGFAKVNLQPGETTHVQLTLDRRSLSFYDVKNHAWTAEPGEFDIYVGRSAGQIELSGKLRVDSLAARADDLLTFPASIKVVQTGGATFRADNGAQLSCRFRGNEMECTTTDLYSPKNRGVRVMMIEASDGNDYIVVCEPRRFGSCPSLVPGEEYQARWVLKGPTNGPAPRSRLTILTNPESTSKREEIGYYILMSRPHPS